MGGFLKKIGYFKTKKISKLQLLLGFLSYLIYVVVAQQFHSSAWIALFVPLIMSFKITPWKVIFGGLVTIIAYLSGVANLVFPHLLFLFSHYVEKYGNSGDAFFVEGEKGLMALLPVVIQFVFLYFIVTHEKKFVEDNQGIVTGYYVYLILFSGGGNTPILRVQGYWLLFVTFFYAKYFKYHAYLASGRNLGWFKFIILCFWLFYAIFRVTRNISGVIPYVFQY